MAGTPPTVKLRCSACGHETLSSLFYRGPGQHRCPVCAGKLVLAPGEPERRSGRDRRRRRVLRRWPDWRQGTDRREP
jgi:DNA-directed RNA polymerase subunit RPC12/RpoP